MHARGAAAVAALWIIATLAFLYTDRKAGRHDGARSSANYYNTHAAALSTSERCTLARDTSLMFESADDTYAAAAWARMAGSVCEPDSSESGAQAAR